MRDSFVETIETIAETRNFIWAIYISTRAIQNLEYISPDILSRTNAKNKKLVPENREYGHIGDEKTI